MTFHASTTRRLIGVACLALGLFASAADAQSENQLRQENQRLQAELADTQRELETAMQRIERLVAEIDRLRRSIAAGGSGSGAIDPPPAPEVVSIDETKPDASPRALLAALGASYEEEFKDAETGAYGSRERQAYIKRVRSWVSRVNREFKGQIVWHVKYVPDTDNAGGMFFEAVDPETGVPLAGANPFRVAIPRSVARRLAERGSMYDVMVVRGVLTPRVMINDERDAPGAFNNPPLIGPFAEFSFAIDARSMLPKDEDEKSNRKRTPATQPAKRSR